MESDKDIAEERLLRVIEGQQPKGASEKNAKPKKVRMKMNHPFGFIQNLLRPKVPSAGAGVLHLDFRFLNQILRFALIAGGIYLAADFILFQAKTKSASLYQLPGLVQSREPQTSDETDHSEPIPDQAAMEYKEAFKNRNPFTGEQAIKPVVVADVAVPEVDLSSLTEGLVLVGINKGAQPEAFIEDTISKRTYFVTVGQPVKNMKVKAIKNNAVVLSYEDKEIEIA